MNIKDKENENKSNSEKKELSPDKQEENSLERQNIILGFDEHPDIVIEKILINIFNNIYNKNKIENYILIFKKKIKELCSKNESYNIILLLLINIRNIIKKYRKIIFEMPSIIELRENNYQKYYFRSYSIDEKYSKKYINFGIDRHTRNYISSPTKNKCLDYYTVVKNLFNKLKGIKNSLKIAAPIITKIFEFPLSQYEPFSILDCENEEFLKILVNDNFINSELKKNRNTKLGSIIQEIMEYNNSNLNIVDKKIQFFNNYQSNILELGEIGSSLDERFPEDAKPISEIKYKIKGYYDNINNIFDEDENNNCEENEENNEPNTEEENIEDKNFPNISMIKICGKNIKKINETSFQQTIVAHKESNNINIIENNKINDFADLNKSINNEKIIKNISINNNLHDNIIINRIFDTANITNINNIANINNDKTKQINIISGQKYLKSREQIWLQKHKNQIKTEHENTKNSLNSNKNSKVEKKEIPSDIDDLVKYIENDNKNGTQNKKKKKNKKKTKKKNKNEIENKTDQNVNQDEKKEKDEIEEINEIKDNFIKNSINRFKIHKIKFKYKSEWLEKITKNF